MHFIEKSKYYGIIYVCSNFVLVVIMTFLYVTYVLKDFWKNHVENIHQKLITQNIHCMQKMLLKIKYFEKGF